MRIYFIPNYTVLHPESREPIVSQGEAILFEAIEAVIEGTGMDHLPGELVFVEDGEKLSKVCARIARTTDLM